MKNDRRTKIAEYIRTHKEVSMKELPDIFGVSINTMRSDIAYLAESGVIRKVYGGVVFQNTDEYMNSKAEERINSMLDTKLSISKEASTLIEDGDVIYVDYGTTTVQIVNFISDKKDIIVVTPNFLVMEKLARHPSVKLIILPGEYESAISGVLSENTIQDMKNYRFTKSFMACTGIDSGFRTTTTSYFQRKIKQMAIEQSNARYLLADSTKFKCQGLLTYGSLSDFDCIYTDSGLPGYIKAYMEENKIKCVLAD